MLILDEPTNHLDLESREALEAALQAFPGALLLISHDRALLDAVGTRTIAVEDRTLHSYVGGWPEYVRVREERGGARARGQARAKAAGRKRRGRSRAAPAHAEARRRPQAKRGAPQLEAEIEARGGRAGASSRQELADPHGLERPALGGEVDPPPRRGEGSASRRSTRSWRPSRAERVARSGSAVARA